MRVVPTIAIAAALAGCCHTPTDALLERRGQLLLEMSELEQRAAEQRALLDSLLPGLLERLEALRRELEEQEQGDDPCWKDCP